MAKTKGVKHAMLMSLLTLVVCLSMLVGSTFAWFTDSVTSTGNIIKSGTLEVTMEWKDATSTGNQLTYIDASEGAIFNSNLWEPGYVEAKNIQIKNAGTLALKYQLNILANGTVSELANVIDVYFAEGEKTLATREMTELKHVGTLTEVLAGMPSNVSGELLKGESDVVTIALKMQETAGNEYQDKSIGSDFSVQLLATQLTAEKDAFDNTYDESSVWDGVYPTAKPDTLVVDTDAKLISINDAAALAYLNTLVNDAWDYGSKWQYTIELNTDVNLFNHQWKPIELYNFVAFDGKGHTISNLYVSTNGNSAGFFGVVSDNDKGNTVVKNLNIDGAYVKGNKYVGTVVGSNKQGALEKVTVNNATVIGVKYVGGIFGSGNGSVNDSTIKNSTVSIYEVVIDPEDNSIDSKEAGGLAGYISNDGKANTTNKVIANNVVENVTVTAPSVASGLVAQPNSSNSGGALIEIKNNTMKNVTITTTADDTADLYVSNNVGGKSIVVDNTAVDCNVSVAAADSKALAEAIKGGNKTVVLSAGNYEFPSIPAGTTIIGQEGVVFENTLSGTLDNVTIKDVHIKNSNAQRWAYSKGTLVFENCTFEATSVYAIHYDGLNGANITYKNCTIIGWAAIGGGAEHVTFDGCKIYGNGRYGLIRLYSPGTIKNCTFDVSAVNTTDVYQDGIHAVDCEIKVSNNTNVNGEMSAIYNISGTGKITEE